MKNKIETKNQGTLKLSIDKNLKDFNPFTIIKNGIKISIDKILKR